MENRSIYLILSKRIYELTEDECLQYFETVKIGIEQIFNEKIIINQRTENANNVHKSIQQIYIKIKVVEQK